MALGAEHPETLRSIHTLALILLSREDYASSEELFRRELESRRRILGPLHQEVLESLDGLICLHGAKNEYAQADMLCREALAIQERLFGPQHPKTVKTLQRIAMFSYRRDDFEQADPMFRRAIAALASICVAGNSAMEDELELCCRVYAKMLGRRGLDHDSVNAAILAAIAGDTKMDMDDIAKGMEIIKLAQLAHLYEAMVTNRLRDRTEAGNDEWICEHLDNCGCFSREDVKRKYNDLARRLGYSDKLIE